MNDAQRWILALGAVLAEVNEEDAGLLGGSHRPSGSAGAASALRGWDIFTPEQATARLEKLLAQPRTEVLAWDLGRAVNVAGWCYVAYLFDAATAWRFIVKAAGRVQTTLSSWSAYGESYLHGRAEWRTGRPPNADDKEQRAIVQRLLSAKDSPWVCSPWNTPLADAAVPSDERRTLSATPSTIRKTLRDAKQDDRIVLRAGTYPGPLEIDKALELVADKLGAAVIESEQGPLVSVDEVGVVLVGLALRTVKSKGKKKGATAVCSSGGFLRLEQCAITAAEFGIDLLDEDAEVYLDGGRISSCGSVGVIVEGGVLVARDTLFEKNGTANLQIGGEARVVLLRAQVSDASGSGLQIHGQANVSLDHCVVEGNPAAGIVVREEAQIAIAETTLRDNDTVQLWLGSSGDATVTRLAVSGGAGHGIQALNGSNGTFTSCKIDGVGGDGVLVHAAARGRFTECVIAKSAGAGVRVVTDANPTFVRCQIAKNAQKVVVEGARGRFVRCTGGDAPTQPEVVRAADLPGELGRKLAQLDALLDDKNPEAYDAMKPGAGAAALARLGKVIFGGKSVPPDLATLFRWHDGQSISASLWSGDNRTPMSIDEAIAAWTFLCDPTEDVLKPWSKTWLPIFTNGAGDYACFVTSGKGAGSLVEYWHTDKRRPTTHASIEAWADSLLASVAH